MVVPDRDPWKLLVAGEEVKIGAVSSVSLAVVVKRINLAIRKRNAPNCLAPAIFAVLILVDVIAEMENIVYRILNGC
jgi:hypothetical protein